MRYQQLMALAWVIVSWNPLMAQYPVFDVHTGSTNKTFLEDRRNGWDYYGHPCPDGADMPRQITKIGYDFPRASQAHFLSIIKGNVKVSLQALNYPELGYFQSSLANVKGGREAFGCIFGRTFDASLFDDDAIEIDYFDSLVAHVLSYQALEDKSEDGYKINVIKDKEDWQIFDTRNRDKTGILLSVRGGHNLTSSDLIKNFESEEFKDDVVRNISRLLGTRPVQKGDYMPYPIFSIQLASHFDNGLCGTARPEKIDEDKLFDPPSTMNYGMSEVGKRAVEELVEGRSRRILIDISGMSVEARKWYYYYLDSLASRGLTVPIMATHVGISGERWDDLEYVENKEVYNNPESYFQHAPDRLSREDINAIYESRGLIGISMDYNTIIRGTKFEEELALVEPGSEAERMVVMKAILSQVFRIIYIVQERDAWDMISLSSNFDAGARPLPVYQTAEQLQMLADDIHNFLNDPEDIFKVYSLNQVNQLMYDFSGEEIASRILYDNAANFVENNLPKKFVKQSRN